MNLLMDFINKCSPKLDTAGATIETTGQVTETALPSVLRNEDIYNSSGFSNDSNSGKLL